MLNKEKGPKKQKSIIMFIPHKQQSIPLFVLKYTLLFFSLCNFELSSRHQIHLNQLLQQLISRRSKLKFRQLTKKKLRIQMYWAHFFCMYISFNIRLTFMHVNLKELWKIKALTGSLAMVFYKINLLLIKIICFPKINSKVSFL